VLDWVRLEEIPMSMSGLGPLLEGLKHYLWYPKPLSCGQENWWQCKKIKREIKKRKQKKKKNKKKEKNRDRNG